MFSVYGKVGRIFRGSMEELQKVVPGAAVSRSGRVDANLPFAAASGQGGGTLHGDQDVAHRHAVAAYVHTIKPEVVRHPLSMVADIMSRSVVTIADSASVGDAWAILAAQQLGQAPVVGADGAVVGLLSRADLMRPDRLPGPNTHALVWKALQIQPVAELMATPVPCVAPVTDIRRVARVLLDTGLPGLPVVDDEGRVCGFVSRSDILRAVVADPPLDLWT